MSAYYIERNTMLSMITGNIESIVAVLGAAVGLFAKIKGNNMVKEMQEAIKEIQDVRSYYKIAMADGTLTEEEKDRLLKESMEAIDEIDDVVALGFKLSPWGKKK